MHICVHEYVFAYVSFFFVTFAIRDEGRDVVTNHRRRNLIYGRAA